MKFGLIPEFIGRLPVITTVSPLDVAALVRILTEPRNALVKQYQKMFEIDGVVLEFSEDAIEAVAEQALARGTGARGLRAIMEVSSRRCSTSPATRRSPRCSSPATSSSRTSTRPSSGTTPRPVASARPASGRPDARGPARPAQPDRVERHTPAASTVSAASARVSTSRPHDDGVRVARTPASAVAAPPVASSPPCVAQRRRVGRGSGPGGKAASRASDRWVASTRAAATADSAQPATPSARTPL